MRRLLTITSLYSCPTIPLDKVVGLEAFSHDRGGRTAPGMKLPEPSVFARELGLHIAFSYAPFFVNV